MIDLEYFEEPINCEFFRVGYTCLTTGLQCAAHVHVANLNADKEMMPLRGELKAELKRLILNSKPPLAHC